MQIIVQYIPINKAIVGSKPPKVPIAPLGPANMAIWKILLPDFVAMKHVSKTDHMIFNRILHPSIEER